MNIEVKKKWVAALRSGDYKQGQGHLKGGDGFCCLGVLCDLHSKEVDHYGWQEQQGGVYSYQGRTGTITNEVSGWADLPVSNDTCGILVSMNDGGGDYALDGKDFNYIADYIEKNY